MPTTAADDIAFRCWCPTRAIARELGISHRTVREYLARIAAVGITWPLPVEVTDQELERRLFGNGGVRAGARHYVEPDWAAVTRELKRPGVTLMILSDISRRSSRRLCLCEWAGSIGHGRAPPIAQLSLTPFHPCWISQSGGWTVVVVANVGIANVTPGTRG